MGVCGPGIEVIVKMRVGGRGDPDGGGQRVDVNEELKLL